jgi:Helicase associated domain
MPPTKRKSPDDETPDDVHHDGDERHEQHVKQQDDHVTLDDDDADAEAAVEAVMGDDEADLSMDADTGDILTDAVQPVAHPNPPSTAPVTTTTTTTPPAATAEHTEPHQEEDDGDVDVDDADDVDADFKRVAVGGDATWNAMLFQLIFYKAVHGDLRPKAKQDEHKPLYDWMVAQRKEFKLYQETPEKSYLSPDQVKVLDHLQFPWNTRGDEHWVRNFEHLKQFRKEHGHCMVPRTFIDVPNLCHWVTDQRRQLKNLKSGKPSTMTKDRQRLLDEVGFVWQVRNRTTWDIRFAELIEFKEQKGSTVVPQREWCCFVLLHHCVVASFSCAPGQPCGCG